MVSARKPAVPDRKPSKRSPRLADLGEVDPLLAEFLTLSRSSLFEPWRALVADPDDLAADIDAMVQRLQVFFSKWVVELVIVLGRRESMRFNELKASLAGISGRTLSQRLKELEAQGLVKRTLHDEMPVRVEYALTKKGTDVAVLALPLVLYLLAHPGE